LYLQSRNEHSQAYLYSQHAAAVIAPLQSDAVQVQAHVLSFVNRPGREGLKSLLSNIDGYLASELPALEKTTARSWSTDPMHRY
jgi:hypothetical protein